jgi:hypothetical protein
MVQSKDKRVHEIPDRGSIAEANGVLPAETGSEASQAFDAIANGNDNIGEYDSFFETLEAVSPNGVLPAETESEASQAFDAISNGNDNIGEYNSFFEALEAVSPNGIDKYYTSPSQ